MPCSPHPPLNVSHRVAQCFKPPPPLQEVPASERAGLAVLLEALQEVCHAHAGGKGSYAAALCTRLIESYLEVRGWGWVVTG